MYKLAIASIVFLCSFTLTPPELSNTKIEDYLEAFVEDRDCMKMSFSGNLFSFKNGGGKESKVDVFQLFIFGEEDPLSRNDVKDINKMVRNSGLELLNSIRSSGDKVDIYVRDDGEIIKDVFMMVVDAEDESGVIFHAEGKIHYSDLDDLNIDFNGSDELKKYRNKN